MIWIGIMIGMFIGTNLGIFILTMCIAADKGDKQIRLASRMRQ